ncbi:MAG: NUDIX hydrolase [Candidatus Uhrbacteria bacterium GW2011_GWE2_45_35]|uniref:NUDIX hydrolase n=2 Tax=Candidatus Uhriibacteriota TaxID=1752732 RepID=A0A0G1MHN7_9BACT|nr:MAG: NUDIX hydrolase [Candidatus Uhrbacteria bacterium GW2011_GWF2_44_350]KKU08028.1 MAG: NUDIX hydrolase [Candidatus Uhrbacteria bacterium GW2011_GWE2_45_35]
MKSLAHQDGSWHRSAHIWLYNSRGEILLQLRAKDKLLAPDCWDVSAAGHVAAGEDPLTSGLRELEEEIGVKTEKESLEFFRILRREALPDAIPNNEFYYIYFLPFSGRAEDLKIQLEELQTVRLFTIKEIRDSLKNNRVKFAQADDYWKEILNEIETRTRE